MNNLSKRTLSLASHGAMLLPVFIITLLVILMPVKASKAATFDVSSKAEFQSALTEAQSNGEDDVINVAAGTIPVSGFLQQLNFNSSEAFSLTIKGAGAGSTILEGVGATGLIQIKSSDEVSISGMTFKNGTYIGGIGASFYVEAKNVTIERCIFTENGPGDTTWVSIGGFGLIANNIFSGNKGPGIFVQSTAYNTSIYLSNNTFDGNLGGGIELNFYTGSCVLQNNVIWGADSSERKISGSSASAVSMYSNIYGEISLGGSVQLLPTNINSDPLFVTDGHWDDNGTPGDTSDDLWTNGDYHLREGSPCIDSGYYDSYTPATDFEGNERVDDPDTENTGTEGTGVGFTPSSYVGDRGAYEYIPSSFPWELFYPAFIKKK